MVDSVELALRRDVWGKSFKDAAGAGAEVDDDWIRVGGWEVGEESRSVSADGTEEVANPGIVEVGIVV